MSNTSNFNLFDLGGNLTTSWVLSAALIIWSFGLTALGVISMLQGAHAGGVWQVLIGLVLVLVAKSSLEILRTKALLGHQTVADLMSRSVVTAPPDLSLDALVKTVLQPNRVSFVPVVENGVLLGHIDTNVLSMIDRENWQNTQVGDVFVGLGTQQITSPKENAAVLLKRMTKANTRRIIVADEQRLIGIVTLSDLMRV